MSETARRARLECTHPSPTERRTHSITDDTERRHIRLEEAPLRLRSFVSDSLTVNECRTLGSARNKVRWQIHCREIPEDVSIFCRSCAEPATPLA